MQKQRGSTPKPPPAAKLDNDVLQFIVDRHDQLWAWITERDDALHNKVLGIVSQIVETQSMDRVLSSGLHEIAEQIQVQMAPLREIPNSHRALEEGDDARLAALNLALERPDFSLPGTTEVGPLLGVPAADMETGSFAS